MHRNAPSPRDPISGQLLAYLPKIPDRIVLTCANSGKRFDASRSQRIRVARGKFLPKIGYCCSQLCSGTLSARALGFTLRTADPILLTCSIAENVFTPLTASVSA
jgi:hypothetical protein